MLKEIEIEERLRTTYPPKVTSITQEKRKTNIKAFSKLIDNDISFNSLEYDQTEEKLYLYNTIKGEKIYIQFPGKESQAKDNKNRPYDFRPKIETKNGEIIKDLVFNDMWGIIEKINIDHHTLIKILSALFFRMGRMIDYNVVDEQYDYEIVSTKGNTVIKSGTHNLKWNKFCLDADIIEALNHEISPIKLNDDTEITFEAFIYFFSLILENEDIKYSYKKYYDNNDNNVNLSSGRIPTCDSMILLSSYFIGSTSLATLLQRYVSGRGVGKCKAVEIEPSTSGLIRLINYRELIEKHLENSNLAYRKNSTITIDGNKIGVAFKIEPQKIAILSSPDKEKKELLCKRKWEVFDIESISVDENQLNQLERSLGSDMTV